MSKIRLCYSQGEEVKFISHLDFLRTMTRVFRRAELPVKYSEGFNPHMVMTKDVDLEEIKQKINECTPRGIKVNSARNAEGLKPLFQIDSALYETSFTTDASIDVNKYIEKDEIMIEKKSKRKINEVNIKDFIRNITIVESDGIKHKLMLHINAGSISNLKPELVIKSMEVFFGCSATDIKIERKEIYFDDMTKVC